jgi:hypothetical protein
MVLIHSDTPLLVIVLQNHFNIGSRYGFLFLINCSTSFYNEPFFYGENDDITEKRETAQERFPFFNPRMVN